MNIYLDDNWADPALVGMLVKAGHQVVRPADVDLVGASDPRHLEHAIGTRFVLLTSAVKDYTDLHRLVAVSGGSHPGIVLVHFDDDPKHHMKPLSGNWSDRGRLLPAKIIVLNNWR